MLSSSRGDPETDGTHAAPLGYYLAAFLKKKKNCLSFQQMPRGFENEELLCVFK